jgi:hypothetical protein
VWNIDTRDDEYFFRYSFVNENTITLAHCCPTVLFALHGAKGIIMVFARQISAVSLDFYKPAYSHRLAQAIDRFAPVFP